VESITALYNRFRDLIHEAARFGVVGLAGLIVTDSGANLLHYGAGMDRFSSVAIATIAATAISFVASRYWTFRHRERTGAGRETAAFFAVNGIGVAISEGCVGLAYTLGLTDGFFYNIALNGGIALATLFRYWSYKRWVWPTAAAASGGVNRRPARLPDRAWLSRLPVGELAKFGVVGAFAFLVTGGGSFLLHVRAGAGPLTSTLIAGAVPVAVSYAGNRWWTFRHRQRIGIGRESIRYVMLDGAGLAVQLSCVGLTAYVLGLHSQFPYDAALIIGTGLGTAFRFWAYREWVWQARRPMSAAARLVLS
jgi:putative flippase GtrA